MKSLGESIVYNEAVEQCFSCGSCCVIPGGNGLGVPGEMICYHQHVLVTTWWCFHWEVVHADQFQQLTGDDVDKRGCVSSCFPSQTMLTLFTPVFTNTCHQKCSLTNKVVLSRPGWLISLWSPLKALLTKAEGSTSWVCTSPSTVVSLCWAPWHIQKLSKFLNIINCSLVLGKSCCLGLFLLRT